MLKALLGKGVILLGILKAFIKELDGIVAS